eukprot:365053-Chlamydomonas_euryale.AAC.21
MSDWCGVHGSCQGTWVRHMISRAQHARQFDRNTKGNSSPGHHASSAELPKPFPVEADLPRKGPRSEAKLRRSEFGQPARRPP